MSSRTMRRTLILGAGGMLGFALVHWLSQQGRDVAATLRGPPKQFQLPRGIEVLTGIDGLDFAAVTAAIAQVRPEVVINCIGIRVAHDGPEVLKMFRLNGAFPRKLSALCDATGIRLVHISSDGVFDGSVGIRLETDPVSATDAYGRSKLWGEHLAGPALTVRTSMIGLSPSREQTLLDWLLAQGNRRLSGFSRVVFSGPTVIEIARFLHLCVLDREPIPTRIVHLAADPIDKCSLLRLMRRTWGLDPGQVIAVDEPVSDRSLGSRRGDVHGDYAPPAWPVMIAELRGFYSTLQMG